MNVNWIDNSKKELTDDLIRQSFENYVLESRVKQGPTYSMTKYPNWIEDLEVDNSENSPEDILLKLKAEWSVFKKTKLSDINKFMQYEKPVKIHGRTVTLDGRQYTSTKLDSELEDMTKRQRNAAIKKWKKGKKTELDEQVEKNEISEYQDIDEWEYNGDTNRIIFWFLLSPDKEKTIGDFLDKNWVSDWIGFDWDNQETRQKLVDDAAIVSTYFRGGGKLPLSSFDQLLKILEGAHDDIPTATGGKTFKFEFQFLGNKSQIDKHMKDIGADAYGELTNMKAKQQKTGKGQATKVVEGRILPEPISRPKKQSSDEYSFIIEDNTKVLTNETITKQWLRNNVMDGIEKMLLNPEYKALNPLEIQNITVTGNAFYDGEKPEIKINYTTNITVKDKYKVVEIANLPKETPTESKVKPSATAFPMDTQFKTLIYNPVRREWSNHVAARLRRLDEKLGA